MVIGLAVMGMTAWLGVPLEGWAQPRTILRVEAKVPRALETLHDLGLLLYGQTDRFYLVADSPGARASLTARGLTVTPFHLSSNLPLYLVFLPREDILGIIAPPASLLYTDGRVALVQMDEATALKVSQKGGELALLPDEPHPVYLTPVRSFTSPTVPDTFIQRLVNKVNPDSIRSKIQRLQDFRTRYSYTDSCRAAEQYVFNYLSALGLDSVVFDPYPYGSYTWRNVIGTRVGRTNPQRVALACGHMDAISETPNSLAPGAEDNASGTVIALEAARAMAGEDFGSTVKFVVFTGEEQGLIGSDHYARLLRGQNVDLLGALNFDMVSWYQDSFGVTIRTNTASMGLAQLENRMAAEYTTLAHFVTTQVGGSDHVSFHNQGYAATGTIEYGYPPIRYPYYHTIHDSLAYLSISLAAEVAKMAIATLATLADSQTTSVEAGPPTLAFPTALFPVYPNPFWVTVRVEYSLAAKGRVRLSIYNVAGQMVRELVNESQSPGKYSVFWDGRDQRAHPLPSGVYLYRLEVSDKSWIRKAVLLR